MKILINKHVLLKPLDQVSKALPGKTSFDILNGILFNAGEDGLTLTAGDSAFSVKANITPDNYELIQSGSIILPGKKIMEIVRKAPQDISIEVNGLQVTIRSGKSKFELSGLDAAEYPVFDSSSGKTISIPGEALRSMINKTIFATSKKEEAAIFTGINFTFGEGKINLTSTDRHRLAKVEYAIENEDQFSVVVRSESLADLLKLVDAKENVELSFHQNKLVIKTSDFTLVSAVLEGSYPDMNKIIPTDFKTLVTVTTARFSDLLERALIVAEEEKTSSIVITVDDEIQIDCKANGGLSTSESMEYVKKEGDGFKVSINAKYVRDALKAIDSEEVIIHFINNLTSVIFKGSDEENEIQLVLPYRSA